LGILLGMSAMLSRDVFWDWLLTHLFLAKTVAAMSSDMSKILEKMRRRRIECAFTARTPSTLRLALPQISQGTSPLTLPNS
jgi:hypothetical protein